MRLTRKFLIGAIPWLFMVTSIAYFIGELIEDQRPSSDWMTVSRVTIGDRKEGQPIILFIERTIKRGFSATWHVNVRRIDGEDLEIVCTASGGGNYRPDATLPRPVTLNWWTFPVQCRLGLGQFIVDTTWLIKDGDRIRPIRVASNRFTVHPRS